MEIKNTYKEISANLSSGDNIIFYQISVEEALRLVDLYEGSIKDELSSRMLDIIELNNGYILEVSKRRRVKHSVLFKSIEERESYLNSTMSPISQIRYFRGASQIQRYLSLTKQEAENFLKTNSTQLRNEANLTSGEQRKVYSFKDASYILLDQHQEEFLLFDSHLLYQEYCTYKADEIAAINIYGKGFENHIDKLIKQLSDNLQISEEVLNYSLESLSTIDQQLAKENLNDLFYINNLLGLSAYLGEVIIRNIGGRWGFEEEYPNYPIVITERGYRIPIMITVRDAINPDSDEKIPSMEIVYSRYKKK